MSFQNVLEIIRREAKSERDKGTKFEELTKRFLLTDPAYANTYKEVYLWPDFFAKTQFGTIDSGIDLVAVNRNGEYCAIQCKCYEENKPVSKGDLDSFF